MKRSMSTLTLVLFLLGVFIGAIDSGIVSPAREIIQNSFGVSRELGTWMITIYTLFYAVSMPIISKMADRYGRRRVYTIAISVFGVGSLLSGLSNNYGSFSFLLIARVIQAIGAGGILPIATTAIGQSFSAEKRGTALGLVGAIYGIATIIGPTIGSALLTGFGTDHWGLIFFINLPLCLLILALGRNMADDRQATPFKLDLAGGLVTAALISSLLYGLTNLDFFHLGTSLASARVWPFLLAFVALIPLFIRVERHAADPFSIWRIFATARCW